MKRVLVGLLCGWVASVVLAADVGGAPAPEAAFSAVQVQALEQHVHQYLVAHPEVIVEAFQVLKKREMDKQVAAAETAIKSNAKALLHRPSTPVVGNPQGDVTLVEFLDYQCPHCKTMQAVIEKLKQADSGVRVVVKELPIFGGHSRYAAKAALAAERQGKFAEMHAALAQAKNPLTEHKILKLAKIVGLDVKQMKKAMQDKGLDDELKANFALAKALNIMGTPAFVVSNATGEQATFIPGATALSGLQKAVVKARASA